MKKLIFYIFFIIFVNSIFLAEVFSSQTLFRRADLGSEFYNNETDTAYCENPTDCVYHGVCYKEGSHKFYYTWPIIVSSCDLIEVCSNGIWYDCLSDDDCKIGSYCLEDYTCYTDIEDVALCGNRSKLAYLRKFECSAPSHLVWPDMGCCPKDCGLKHDHEYVRFTESEPSGLSMSDFTIEDTGPFYELSSKYLEIILPKNMNVKISKDGEELNLNSKELERLSKKRLLVQPPQAFGYHQAKSEISTQSSIFSGKIIKEIKKIDTYVIEVPSSKYNSLINDLRRKGYSVYEDKRVHITLNDSVPLIEADKVWSSGVTGNNVNVSILDTGISYDHPDLMNKVLNVEDWVNENYEGLLSVYDVLCKNQDIKNKTFVIDNTFKGKPLLVSLPTGAMCGFLSNCERKWVYTTLSNFDIYLYDEYHNLLANYTHEDLPFEGVFLESVPENTEELIITVNSTGKYNSCKWDGITLNDIWLSLNSYTPCLYGIFDQTTTIQPPGTPNSIDNLWKTGYVYFPDIGDILAVLSNVQEDFNHSLPEYTYDFISLDMDEDGYYEIGLTQPQVGVDNPSWKQGDNLTYRGFNFTARLFTYCVGPGCEDINGIYAVLQITKSPFPASYDLGIPTPAAMDFHGHGTHCAGIAVGTGQASDGTYTGVAPNANLIIGKVLNRDGSGYMSDATDAIIWATDNGANVISISLGTDDYPSYYCTYGPNYDAINYAMNKNVTVVIAAGNSGPSPETINFPGCIDKVITVGAVNKNRVIASFSSRGPTPQGTVKPDIVTPGVDIAAARGFYINPITSEKKLTSMGSPLNEYYTIASGTSMATPHVAGVIALLKETYPELAPSEIKHILMYTALDLHYNENLQGSGLINAFRAFEFNDTDTNDTDTDCESDGTKNDGICYEECGASINCSGVGPSEANTCCWGCYYVDINADGIVDIYDAILVGIHFGSSVEDNSETPDEDETVNWDEIADIKTDGVIDIYDAIILANNFGTVCEEEEIVEPLGFISNPIIIIIVVLVILVSILGVFKLFAKKY